MMLRASSFIPTISNSLKVAVMHVVNCIVSSTGLFIAACSANVAAENYLVYCIVNRNGEPILKMMSLYTSHEY